jgi:hypothetical protein
MGGKLHVYKRDNSRFWQCSAYLAGRNHRTTTKAESLEHAKGIAEDWYFNLRVKDHADELCLLKKVLRRAGKAFPGRPTAYDIPISTCV